MHTRLQMGSAGSPESVFINLHGQKRAERGATISLSPRVWDGGSEKYTEVCTDCRGSGGSAALN